MSRFIVVDGLDGSGKGTQIALLRESLRRYPVVFTREPGGTPVAEDIRKILLGRYQPESTALSDMLQFFAARHDHIVNLIAPALVNFQHVITDRFDSSTVGFQLYGEDQKEELGDVFRYLRRLVMGYGRESFGIPDAYVFLDLEARIAYERCRKIMEEKNSKFDVRPIDFHERVREGFRAFAEEYGNESEMIFIDASQTVEQVQSELVAVIERIFAEDDSNREG